MPKTTARDTTQLLLDWNRGDEQAREQVMQRVYEKLRQLARHYFRAERRENTLQPTALVHETYLSLIQQSRVKWRNRAHFFGVAAKLMQRVLVHHARARNAAKRGGGALKVDLGDISLTTQARDIDVLALEEVLERLRQVDPRLYEMVTLRFYGGLTAIEISAVLGVSETTVHRDWRLAKAWLQRELLPPPGAD